MKQSVKKPNFFIVGAPKCGTTSLSRYLKDHPDIFISEIKEPDFFATDLYRSIKSKEEYLRLFRGAESYKAAGEASTTYLYSDEAIENILKFNPDAKFTVMIRNPVDMFHSFHSQNLNNLNENIKNPEKAWGLQEERSKGRFIPSTCDDPKFLQYGEICKLGEQIKQLYKTVPDKDNVKIIKFNGFKDETKKVYEEVLNFLGLESDHRKDFPVYGKNSTLKSRIIKKLLKSFTQNRSIKKLSSIIKGKIGITYWPFIRKLNQWNKKEATRKPLRKGFRKQLENYFKEDQKLLTKIINKN